MTGPEQQLREELVAVQESLMHQQRDLQQMHEVLLSHENEIEELRKEVTQLRGELDTRLGEDRPSNPEHEKPPHY